MEEETGYAAEEIIKYHKSNGDIMGLLYKWENLTKVRQYLGDIEESGKGYTNVAFTMTTKLGEEKTFLWNGIDNKGKRSSSGIYFLKIKVKGEKPVTRKIVVL